MEEALYERVLAHVPTSLLHESYNAVLREEFASVARTLDDVAAAFAKLEEVHDAVSKLQQSHESSTGSLMASAENTMMLQRQLQRQVEELAVGMKVAQVERKRKRVEEKATVARVLTSVRTRGGEKEITASTSRDVGGYQTKRLEAAVDSDLGPESMGEEAKRSSKKLKSDEKVEREAAAASRSDSSSSSGSESNADSDGDEESDSEKVAGSEAAWKTLMSKGKSSTEVKSEPVYAVDAKTTETGDSTDTQLLKISATYCKSVEVKSEPLPAVHVEKPEKDNSAISQLLKKSATYWKAIVEQVDKRSPLNRLHIIPDVLAALKESVEADMDGSQQADVACTLKILVDWGTRNRDYEAQHAELYLEYVAVVEAYLDRLPNSAQKDELKRLTETLSSTIEAFDGLVLSERKMAAVVAAILDAKKKNAFTTAIGRPDSVTGEKRIGRLLGLLIAFKKETTGNVNSSFDKRLIKMASNLSRWLNRDLRVPLYLALYRMIVGSLRECLAQIPKTPTRNRVLEMSDAISDSPKCKERVAKIHTRAMQLLEEIKQYRGKSLQSKEANQLTNALRVIAQDATIGWNPHRESTMLDCVKEFKSVLEAQGMTDMEAWTTCQICLRAVKKWKIGEQVE